MGPRTGTVAFVLADVEGSTAGDSFVAVFRSAVDTVRAGGSVAAGEASAFALGELSHHAGPEQRRCQEDPP